MQILVTRVEYLIDDYMDHYEVASSEAIDIMIEDLESARRERQRKSSETKEE